MNRPNFCAPLLGAFVLLLSLGSLPSHAAASPDLAAYAEHLLATAYPADQPGAAALVMKDGQVVESGPAARIFETPQHPYTAALMAAAFDLETVDTGAVRT